VRPAGTALLDGGAAARVPVQAASAAVAAVPADAACDDPAAMRGTGIPPAAAPFNTFFVLMALGPPGMITYKPDFLLS
jgi:hypothetical protein